jgi:hypothetical protein
MGTENSSDTLVYISQIIRRHISENVNSSYSALQDIFCIYVNKSLVAMFTEYPAGPYPEHI